MLQYNVPIHVHQLIDSTNLEAKRLAAEGAEHGTVVIAEEQTAGRGRLGRKFASPSGGGLYMSIILRPQMSPSLAVDVTTMAAVAVCRTLEKECGKEPKIKWVNDVFLNDRKICGILTEGVINGSTGQLDSLVLGIGINVTTPTDAFPEEVQMIAGSIFGKEPATVSRGQIAAGIINEVLQRSAYLGTHKHMDEYRKRCFTLGKKVSFLRDDEMQIGTAMAISDDGGLVVELEQGGRITLQSGEVSVRPV